MKTIYIILIIIVAVLFAIINEEIHKRFCTDCGARMDKHYDVEEDAEVWQCPRCGRSYIK